MTDQEIVGGKTNSSGSERLTLDDPYSDLLNTHSFQSSGPNFKFWQ